VVNANARVVKLLLEVILVFALLMAEAITTNARVVKLLLEVILVFALLRLLEVVLVCVLLMAEESNRGLREEC
jgi:hypothetical protein